MITRRSMPYTNARSTFRPRSIFPTFGSSDSPCNCANVNHIKQYQKRPIPNPPHPYAFFGLFFASSTVWDFVTFNGRGGHFWINHFFKNLTFFSYVLHERNGSRSQSARQPNGSCIIHVGAYWIFSRALTETSVRMKSPCCILLKYCNNSINLNILVDVAPRVLG